jgi:membrane protein required for colicin V production
MQNYDVIMLAVLTISVIIGAVKGMSWQIAMVASIVISFFVAREFHPALAEALSGVNDPWNKFIAMASLYLLTSLGIWMLFAFCAKQIDKYEMKTFDRQTGALLGIVNGVLLCTILTMCAIAFGGENMHNRIAQSKSGPYVSRVLDIVEPIIPEDLQDSLNDYLQQLHNLIEANEQIEPLLDSDDSE